MTRDTSFGEAGDDVLERLFALEQFGIKLGLDNIRALTAALDHPHTAYPTIHVAGTNGKGSVSAMVERGLRAAGHRTGRYTSPHLDRIEERIAIDGIPVATADFRESAREILALAERLRGSGTLAATPTFFEVTTAMAFEIFRRARVDVAVIEVGLGGRFDATNVIVPAVCAITSIALDHEQHLGGTLASIAHQKAGIIKPGVPVVVGETPAAARAVVERVAHEQGAPIVPAALDLATVVSLTRGRATVSIHTPVAAYDDIPLGLQGAHQVGNAVIAVRALEVTGSTGLPIDRQHIVSALRDVFWPARLEWLRVPAGGALLIDAAHNPAGAQALAGYLTASGRAPLPIVLTVMRDKDVDGMVRALAPVASRFIATSVESKRALEADALAERIRSATGVGVDAVDDADAAVDAALSASPHAVAAGSIFFVGPLRARLIAAGAVSFSS